MYPTVQGIPALPDLTHPDELMQFGDRILSLSVTLGIFLVVFGLAIAAIKWTYRQPEPPFPLLEDWVGGYLVLLQKLPHFILILAFLIGGFFLSSTLANRYHHWEQSRVQDIAASVSGERLEQPSPRIRYVIEEPYKYSNWINGQLVEIEDTREVNRFLALSGSEIAVTLNQSTDVSNNNAIYLAEFEAEYEVINSLREPRTFFFEIPPPYGYSLLQNFKVERDGERMLQINPGDYGFPFALQPGEETRFRVTYKAQGGPRWVDNSQGESLSNFRLTALANFPKADFASGIIPTATNQERSGTRFSWVFEDNVSVRNPFGVFTATETVRKTGVLPRLLLLAPGIFLWWIVLLYLSVPMRLIDVSLAGGLFFAGLLSLTYFSRVMDVTLAWLLLSPILLVLVWGLGNHKRASLAALICTIAGAVLPIWGLIVSYTGLTLSVAGLLSVIWLALRHWYGGVGRLRF